MAAQPDASPISKLLHTLGITREDLHRHSDKMREFLTTSNPPSSRVVEGDLTFRARSNSDLRSHSRSIGSASSLSRSLSRASTSSYRDSTPPATPIKSEPHDGGLPHRPMDNMEIVLERQRRQRRKQRGRGSRSDIQPPPSPSPSNASHSGSMHGSHSLSREDSMFASSSSIASSESLSTRASEPADPPPVTPQRSRYYREHTMTSGSQTRLETQNHPAETQSPANPVTSTLTSQASTTLPVFAYGYLVQQYPSLMGYRMPDGPSTLPYTPQAQRTVPFSSSFPQSSPAKIPESSPVLATSPASSPMRVNLVSSPGPLDMSSHSEQSLPYKLPPGPYSDVKPELSYAALVGQAILSSPEHRLTLQEIYEWIVTVYPHYKRGETTWMNSIRHVLSTTTVFRKVTRDRALGRTLWAIFDEDLECFKDGGYQKNGKDDKTKGKSRARKREDDDASGDSRKTKKARSHGNIASSSNSQPSFPALASLPSVPIFAPGPTPQHQPYYESCIPTQPVPADLIFPPLPPASALNQVLSQTASASKDIGRDATPPTDPASSPVSSFSASSLHPTSSSSSLASLPDLTPNRSSSPPSSLPPSSDLDINVHNRDTDSDHVASDDVQEDQNMYLNEDEYLNVSVLRSWGDSSPALEGLQPGIQLLDADNIGKADKGKKSARKASVAYAEEYIRALTERNQNSFLPAEPVSPTLVCRKGKAVDLGRPSTPPASSRGAGPSTPTRKFQISPLTTPISHKGIHMSPSPSLAHYKSNLDPPPALGKGDIHPLEMGSRDDEDDDPNRTPRRRTTVVDPNVMLGPPVTPKRLLFGTSLGDSPFRTPFGGALGISPFRTPGSRGLEDLRRQMDSPRGLYGKSQLLYDSPGIDTSSQSHWW